jgi:hypothetical protein
MRPVKIEGAATFSSAAAVKRRIGVNLVKTFVDESGIEFQV